MVAIPQIISGGNHDRKRLFFGKVIGKAPNVAGTKWVFVVSFKAQEGELQQPGVEHSLSEVLRGIKAFDNHTAALQWSTI